MSLESRAWDEGFSMATKFPFRADSPDVRVEMSLDNDVNWDTISDSLRVTSSRSAAGG